VSEHVRNPRARTGARQRRRLLLAACGAWAGCAAAAEIRSFTLDREAQRYHVVSEAFIDAPLDAVYGVLVDYDHYDRISSIFKETRYLERHPDGSGVVYTKARGCIAFFCQTVERVEQLDVVPDTEITATVIPERSDTRYSRAHWQLEPQGEGTLLHYELVMEPDFWVPPLIGPLLVKHALKAGGERAAARVEKLARAAPAG
jgi:Polyketide cyclase / dehydrase and lipid transport